MIRLLWVPESFLWGYLASDWSFFCLTGAPPLLVSSFPLKVSQQSLSIDNQRKSQNLELSFSIIHRLLGIITSLPVEDKNFYVVYFLLIFGPMGITWEGGRPNRWRHSHTMGMGREIQNTRLQRGVEFPEAFVHSKNFLRPTGFTMFRVIFSKRELLPIYCQPPR